MVTARSRAFLVTGPSSVSAIATAFLERKVNLFTSGRGEERAWKLRPSLDPAFPALRVCAAWSISYFSSPWGQWGSGRSFGDEKEETLSLERVEGNMKRKPGLVNDRVVHT